MSKKVRMLLGIACAVAMMVAGTAVAGASPASRSSNVCTGGAIAGGTYRNLRITGDCTVPDGVTVTVRGDVVVAPGATFDAVTLGTVNIGRNVLVGRDATFGLGCAPDAGPPQCTATTDDVVGGSIFAFGAHTLYLTAITVHGSLVSIGGGSGGGPSNFPIKDSTFDGNVLVTGWSGTWFGILRSTVHGSTVLIGIRTNNATPQGPDSNEVVNNTIGGSLVCFGNNPHAQWGDAIEGAPPGYQWNIVSGYALGECAPLSLHSR